MVCAHCAAPVNICCDCFLRHVHYNEWLPTGGTGSFTCQLLRIFEEVSVHTWPHLKSSELAFAEGDGTKVYASCLTFYDIIPADLCARHEELLGARALKALCLLSREPYMISSAQVSRRQLLLLQEP
jgi:hypothetical protein